MGINVLSLFDGISCGQVALERAGIEVDKYFASEIDANAIKVTQHNYPNTIQLGDVKNIRSEDLPRIDLLIGGPPCQGFSIAGTRLNFDDPRSQMLWEFVRLLRETKPQNFLMENVVMRKDIERVVNLEMGREPHCINSADFSAQRRVRLYWFDGTLLSYTKSTETVQDIFDSGDVIDVTHRCQKKRGTRGEELVKKRTQYGIGKAYALIACTPKPGAIGTTNLLVDGRYYNFTVQGYERLQTLPRGYVDEVDISTLAKYRGIGNGWTVDVIAHLFKGLKQDCGGQFQPSLEGIA